MSSPSQADTDNSEDLVRLRTKSLSRDQARSRRNHNNNLVDLYAAAGGSQSSSSGYHGSRGGGGGGVGTGFVSRLKFIDGGVGGGGNFNGGFRERELSPDFQPTSSSAVTSAGNRRHTVALDGDVLDPRRKASEQRLRFMDDEVTDRTCSEDDGFGDMR